MKAALAVFVVALIFHLGYFALDHDHAARDAKKYLVPAENLLAGHGYVRNGQPETERTPGYPLVLAALRGVGLDLRQIALLQHLASAAAAAALVLFAQRMTGNAFIATLAGIVMAVDLPTIHHANLILTETLFTIMGLALFALIWRGQAAAAGLLLGAMVLVRPIAPVEDRHSCLSGQARVPVLHSPHHRLRRLRAAAAGPVALSQPSRVGCGDVVDELGESAVELPCGGRAGVRRRG